MEKKKVLEMANESAEWYLRNFNVLGIEYEKDSNWFYAVGKYENSNRVTVLSVAKKDSGCKTSVFWDLYRFSIIYAMHACGYKIEWSGNGNPIWPIWYLNTFEMKNFLFEYDNMISKYGFNRASVQTNSFA